MGAKLFLADGQTDGQTDAFKIAFLVHFLCVPCDSRTKELLVISLYNIQLVLLIETHFALCKVRTEFLYNI